MIPTQPSTTQPSEAPNGAATSVRPPWFAAAAIVALTICGLRMEGRRWWCACGNPWIWVGDIWSEHCSQHVFDPYSFTHISHGLIAFTLLTYVRPRWSLGWRLCATVAYASSWELLENSSLVIARYRHATVALNYVGDSIANSMGDILSCATGFFIAHAIGLRRTLLLFVVLEIMLLVTIRDNLTLNIIMLLHPSAAIKAWQATGH